MSSIPGSLIKGQEPSSSSSALEKRVDELNAQAREMWESENWQGVLEVAGEALKLSRQFGYHKGTSAACRNAAFAQYMLSDYAAALREAFEALRLAQEEQDEHGQGEALTILALIHWSLGNYDEALRQGLQAIVHFERPPICKSGLAWCYTVLGGIYHSIGDYNQALGYHKRSNELFAEMHHIMGQARSLSGLGVVYHALGNLDDALRVHRESLALFQSINNRVGEARALSDIGAVYQDRGEDELAMELHRRSLAIRRELRNRPAEATSLLFLGRLFLKRSELDQALETLLEALHIAEDLGTKPKEFQAHLYLSEAYEASGNLCKALHHRKEAQRVREQVFSEETSTRMRNLQIRFELERAQRDAEIHRLRNVELKEKNEKLAALLKELQAAQSELVQSEQMASLGKLVAALVHEVNSPLGAIRSLTDLVVRSVEKIEANIRTAESLEALRQRRSLWNALNTLKESHRSGSDAVKRIDKLVQSLKSFAGLDQAGYQRVNLNETLENTLTLIAPELRGRIRLVSAFGHLPEIYCYAPELNQVFMHLLRNAAEAIEGTGEIRVTTSADEEWIRIEFADTGRGISAEELQELFNPRFNSRGSRVRASVSLFTSLHIVQKHRGDIVVKSEPGKGSVFTVVLPRNLEHQLGEP